MRATQIEGRFRATAIARGAEVGERGSKPQRTSHAQLSPGRQVLLGLAVHRRGVEEDYATIEGGLDDLVAGLFLVAAHVEDLAGPQAYDGDLGKAP